VPPPTSEDEAAALGGTPPSRLSTGGRSGGAAQLTIIRWRDIPAQVTAKHGRLSHKVVLHKRFQTAIDRTAMKAGLRAASDYIGEWRRDARPCGTDLEAEVKAEAARLDAAYPRDVLKGLVESGGLASIGQEPASQEPA